MIIFTQGVRKEGLIFSNKKFKSITEDKGMWLKLNFVKLILVIEFLNAPNE